MSSLTNSTEEWATAASLVSNVRDAEEKKAVVSCRGPSIRFLAGEGRVEGQGTACISRRRRGLRWRHGYRDRRVERQSHWPEALFRRLAILIH